MTNSLFDYILSYRNATLSPLFASFAPDIQAEVIRSFFDEDAYIFLDDEVSEPAALSYIQAHTKRLTLASATTGEILMQIPLSPAVDENATDLSIYI